MASSVTQMISLLSSASGMCKIFRPAVGEAIR